MPELTITVRFDATRELLAALAAFAGMASPALAPTVVTPGTDAPIAAPPPPHERRKRQCSPEVRAAAAERMRAWQAARKREREAGAMTDASPPPPEAAPPEPVPAPGPAPFPDDEPQPVVTSLQPAAPAGPGVVDYNTAFRWAAERGLASVRHGMDLERVNAERVKHGLAPFVLRKRGAA